MSKRNLIIVAVVLGLVALAVQFFSGSRRGSLDDRINTTLASADHVERIDEIVIETGSGSLHLQKLGKIWQIQEKSGYPASVEDVLNLLQKVVTYKISSVITENPERLAYFTLLYKNETADSSQVGSQLTFLAKKKPVYTLLVGKHRDSISKDSDMPSYPDGTYVRIGETKAVYLIKENLDLNVDAKIWMQKELISIKEDEIKAVRYETQAGQLVLSREKKEKKLILEDLNKGEKTSDFERNNLASELKNFTVDEIFPLDEIPTSGMEMKTAVSVELFDQSTFDFQVFVRQASDPLKAKAKKSKPKYYLKLVQSPSEVSKQKWQHLYSLSDKWIFEIEEWRAKTWLKSRKDFAKGKDELE